MDSALLKSAHELPDALMEEGSAMGLDDVGPPPRSIRIIDADENFLVCCYYFFIALFFILSEIGKKTF